MPGMIKDKYFLEAAHNLMILQGTGVKLIGGKKVMDQLRELYVKF